MFLKDLSNDTPHYGGDARKKTSVPRRKLWNPKK